MISASTKLSLQQKLPADSTAFDEDQALGNRIFPTTQTWPVAFTTTYWNVVLEAQGQSPAAEKALENDVALIGAPCMDSSGGKARELIAEKKP
jgi:hypothetical protein